MKKKANRAAKATSAPIVRRPARGRPRAIESAVAKKIVLDSLRKGMSKQTAAAAGGMSVTTLRNEELRDPTFAEEMNTAISLGKADLIKSVQRDALKDGRLALTVLARRWPDEWAEKKEAARDVNVNVTGTIDLDTEHRRRRLAAIATAVGAAVVAEVDAGNPAADGPPRIDGAQDTEGESGSEPV